ncbi:MAG: roadblock/LC7 domain-containing protein [Candidatus Micrarchaeia archaeon]
MAEKRQELESVLADLRRVGDVEASAIVRRDGLMIASDMPNYVDGRTIAAMTATLVGTGESSVSELKLGEFGQAIIESAEGKLVAMGAGSQAVLACLVSKDANLGLVLVSMEKSARVIAGMLGA